ncbi:hypothetical protein BgiMline_022029, partial [Biomphalaria glabrata]
MSIKVKVIPPELICILLRFVSGDINRQLIEYILRPGVNTTSDTFIFNITDK